MVQTPRLSPCPRHLGNVLEFMRLLWSLEHALQKTSKRMARQIGLTGPQRLALRLIGRFPGLAPGELAAILQLHPSTITGILLRLQRRQLITRRLDASDRRRAQLRLTATGRRLNRPTTGTVEEAVKLVLTRVEQPQLVAAGGVLTALTEQLSRDPQTIPR